MVIPGVLGFNPNQIRVEYSSIVLGWRGPLSHVSVLTYLLFLIKVFIITRHYKTAICLIKKVPTPTKKKQYIRVSDTLRELAGDWTPVTLNCDDQLRL